MDWFDGIPVNLERLNLGKMSAEGLVKSAVTSHTSTFWVYCKSQRDLRAVLSAIIVFAVSLIIFDQNERKWRKYVRNLTNVCVINELLITEA